MFLSDLKNKPWKLYQVFRSSPDTGVIILTLEDKKLAKVPLMVELGWFLLTKINEKPRLIVNTKHTPQVSFPVEANPDSPMTITEFVENLPWRDIVAKTLPEGTFA